MAAVRHPFGLVSVLMRVIDAPAGFLGDWRCFLRPCGCGRIAGCLEAFCMGEGHYALILSVEALFGLAGVSFSLVCR